MATLTFNIAILTVLCVAMVVVMHAALRLTMLAGTFGILAYKKGDQLKFYLKGINKVMPANIAHMFDKRAQKGVLFFTQQEAKDVTEWLEDQFHNQKGYISFFVGTALMIGLFGTFAGLLKSIDEMGGIILSLTGDINLGEIIAGFAGPLSGMAIGFGSSLFGVATAIILNFMQYILSRNQAAFIEDIEDWLKGKMIDNQSSEVLAQINETLGHGGAGQAVPMAQPQGGGGMGAGFMDVFVDSMSEFSQKMEANNKSSEVVFKMLSKNFEKSDESLENQMALLEGIANSLKELNINQYTSTSTMEESLQEISNVILSEHKTMKKMLLAQEENNRVLIELVEKLNSRIDKLEKR